MSKAVCDVCPNRCSLDDGELGVCGGRVARNGRCEVFCRGQLSAVHMDPVEKKPLYHFYPGSDALSLGGWGCNLKCRGCQNDSLSRARACDVPRHVYSAGDIVHAAKRHACRSIAYTYNEPIIWWEFADEVAEAAHVQGIKNIMVTAGYVTAEVRERVFSHMDAANVDLKGFSESFYRSWAHGRLGAVLETLEYLHQLKDFWLEVTTLLIPGINDDEKMLADEFGWFADHLGSYVPLHLSAFHPAAEALEIPATPLDTLLKAGRMAREAGIKYVYLGNVPVMNDTKCPKCGSVVIRRMGYRVDLCGLNGGCCKACGERLSGVFD